MKFNITEPMARELLRTEVVHTGIHAGTTSPILYPLYARIGVVFPHLKAEFSYLDWSKFSQDNPVSTT